MSEPRQPPLISVGGFLVTCLITLALLVVVFGYLSRTMMAGQFDAFNETALLTLHRTSCPAFDYLAIALTNIGGTKGTTLIATGIVIVLLRQKRYLESVVLVTILLGGTAFIVVIKHSFQHARPQLWPCIYPESGYSFPSGHSLMSVCFYGFLGGATLMSHRRKPWAWLAMACCLGMAASIIWCRLYLGVHWPTDVMGGALLGTVWVILGLLGLRYGQILSSGYVRLRRRRQPDSADGGSGDPGASAHCEN